MHHILLKVCSFVLYIIKLPGFTSSQIRAFAEKPCTHINFKKITSNSFHFTSLSGNITIASGLIQSYTAFPIAPANKRLCPLALSVSLWSTPLQHPVWLSEMLVKVSTVYRFHIDQRVLSGMMCGLCASLNMFSTSIVVFKIEPHASVSAPIESQMRLKIHSALQFESKDMKFPKNASQEALRAAGRMLTDHQQWDCRLGCRTSCCQEATSPSVCHAVSLL